MTNYMEKVIFWVERISLIAILCGVALLLLKLLRQSISFMRSVKDKSQHQQQQQAAAAIDATVPAVSKSGEKKADLAAGVILPNTKASIVLLVDDVAVGDHSTVAVHPDKLKELNVLDGGIVTVKGKTKKTTIAIVTADANVVPSKVQMTKVVQSNLRIRLGDVASITVANDIKNAKSITIGPYSDTMVGQSGNLLDVSGKPYFAGNNCPLKVGDTFLATVGMHRVEFKVLTIKGVGGKEEEFGIVVTETDIVIDPSPLSRGDADRLDEIRYDDVGGCGRQLAMIREIVEVPLLNPQIFRAVGIPPPKGVLLYGPPGSGKTLIGRALANETGAELIVLNGPEIVSKLPWEGASILHKAFDTAATKSPSIIFIDVIDSIAPKRVKESTLDLGKGVATLLLALMDGIKENANVMVIAATNHPNAIDCALRRFGRFDREIEIGVPDVAGRLEVLRIKTRNMKLSKDCNLERIAKDCHGYVGADLAQLCMEAAFQAMKGKLHVTGVHAESSASIEISNDHFAHALRVTKPSALAGNLVEVPNISWEDVGGLEDVKKELCETIKYPVMHADMFEKFGMQPSKGVLFYGPSGCGKTLLAKAIANECDANFISVKGPELLTKWFGESESNVRELFDKARAAAPCILFFDEIDSIANSRGGSDKDVQIGDRVLNQILTEIDGVGAKKNVFVIGATNRPDILDSAMTRPGRLDQLIYIPLPDWLSRMAIFKAALRKSPVEDGVDIAMLASATEGFSGADITEICQRATKNAIRDAINADMIRAKQIATGELDVSEPYVDPVPCIRKDHFEEAMSRARRSVSDMDIKRYDQFATKMKVDATAAGSANFRFDA